MGSERALPPHVHIKRCKPPPPPAGVPYRSHCGVAAIVCIGVAPTVMVFCTASFCHSSVVAARQLQAAVEQRAHNSEENPAVVNCSHLHVCCSAAPNALQAAIEQLAHNSEDSMWVKLGGCHLADGKLKKVRLVPCEQHTAVVLRLMRLLRLLWPLGQGWMCG